MKKLIGSIVVSAGLAVAALVGVNIWSQAEDTTQAFELTAPAPQRDGFYILPLPEDRSTVAKADVVGAPLIDQVDKLAEDVGAVLNPIDDRALGFFELDGEHDWIKMVAPTYRAGVADAEMLNVTCGYYPQICATMNDEDLGLRSSVGTQQNSVDEENSIDDGALGFFELDGERDWIKMVAPTYRAVAADAEVLKVTCGFYPQICAARGDRL